MTWMTTEKKGKTGPTPPDRVKTDKNWEDAMSDALKKKRPEDGWPKPDGADNSVNHTRNPA